MEDRVPPLWKDQADLIQRSGHVHGNWYQQTYPDVAALGMDPAEHYLKYGAALGRNPGKGFDTKYYLETHPELAATGMNPLLHYIFEGAARGDRPKGPSPRETGKRAVEVIRANLLSLGFTDRPLEELRGLEANHEDSSVRARAGRELAMWHMREKTAEGYRLALDHLGKARAASTERAFLGRVATLEILCHHFLGDDEAGLEVWHRAAEFGVVDPDVVLARINLTEDPKARLALVNVMLAEFGISELALAPGDGAAYDRLTAAHPPVPVEGGPKVTVLVAAYDAADTILTTLRSLAEQSWRNLEILVLDDYSPDGGAMARLVEAHAVQDPRIRLIRMDQNGGAYVARNRGLDEATGEFVTLHDADDWSHPEKIEIQVRHLMENPDVLGCTTNQARANSDLGFTRWTGRGQFLIGNTSSFMFRRMPVHEHFGYWDTVRFSADNEFIRRIRGRFGQEAVTEMQTGPYSFQRDSDTSIIADEALGINGFLFGVRKEYFDAQRFHRDSGAKLKYGDNPTARPFPVPAIMRPERKRLMTGRHFPLVLASDFRMPGGSVASCLEDIAFAKHYGIPLGIVEMYRYDLETRGKIRTHMLDEVRREIDGEIVQIIGFGETVSCDLLMVRYPPVLQERQRYVPNIEAREVKIIVNQPPRSHYGENGVTRYHFSDCANNIRHYFGKDATWHPIGPLARDAIETHHAHELDAIDLAPTDWHNIIDVAGWDRGVRTRGPRDKLRIGRHSRDSAVKWPETADAICAAYPDLEDIEVHVLGGAKAPAKVLGHVPENWVVHPFGALHPRQFLAGIDVFVYFSHSGWVESFGRTIIEAMAAGVPVILPKAYQPLFKDAALYATPDEAVPLARWLHANPAAYDAQVELAQAYVAEQFSYEMHAARLRAEGVAINQQMAAAE